MSAGRKLSNFRQLSFTCDSPSPRPKRGSLKKQFSEDISDFKDPWFDQGPEINLKTKKCDKNATDRPPPVKVAWGDKTDNNLALNEEVIIKKCKEVKRTASGKLTRHSSLEKDSILNSKQELAERLRNKPQIADKENEKTDAKPNLQIYLAHNAQDNFHSNISDSQTLDSIETNEHFLERSQPKYLQPLMTNMGQFQIKKSANKKPLDSPKAVDINQKRPNFSRSNTIVVVPVVEKDTDPPAPLSNQEQPKPNESNGINVIIRPMTAQSRREKFQKRTNSAFHGTSKDQPATINFRPPLIRSSSAPSTKPEKGKFLASKRKLKGSKKFNSPKSGDRSPKNIEATEWKNAAHTGSEIVTMVSLISPSGSENEDGSEDESRERPKSVLKRENGVVEKSASPIVKNEDVHKNVSLRKTVKSVSFQQSSIHAVRSFSASFPARRGSMATALTLGNTTGPNKANASKTQEKRGTNPSSPDANERVPKRRLVRSSTEEAKPSSSWQKAAAQIGQITRTEKAATFTIDIQTKTNNTTDDDSKFSESSMKLNLEENVILVSPEEKKTNQDPKPIEEPTYDTPKEKQCWAMYCKMTAKGINVSYDTILRGMLTPTEYRIRRRTSIADEMNMLVNPPTDDAKPAPTEGHVGLPQSSE